MSDVAKKANEGFFMRPYTMFEKDTKRTSLETWIRGIAYSFGRDEHVARWGYKKFCEKLGISRSTVARKVKRMKDDPNFHVEREGGKYSTYEYVGKRNDESHIRTEYYFRTEMFTVYGVERRLTPAEVDVLSLVYTHTLDKGYSEGSFSSMAGILKLAVATVCRAVFALFSADLISRPSRGENRRRLSRFCANMKVLRKAERADRKKTKQKEQKQPVKLSPEVAAANAKAERESYYARLREKALNVADRNAEQAKSNPRYREISAALARLEIDIAKADVGGDLARVQLLNAEKTRLSVEGRQILATVGMTVEMLEPQFTCRKCSDTGFLRSGAACDCYNPRGGL